MTMWVSDTIKHITMLIMLVIIILVSIYAKILSDSKNSISLKYELLQAQLEQANKEAKLASIKTQKEIVKIQKIYVPKKEYITKFVKVENETDCNATNRLLYDFEY